MPVLVFLEYGVLDLNLIKEHLAGRFELQILEPEVFSIEYTVTESGRQQTVYVSELDAEDGRKYLRFSCAVAPLSDFDALKCLQINWVQRVGYLAVSELAGETFIKMCENRPYEGLTTVEIDYIISVIAPLADVMEMALTQGNDIV